MEENLHKITRRKMNKAILIILLITTNIISACSQEDRGNYLELKEIKTEKSNNHKRVKGSKVYLVIPTEYKYSQELSRFQKKERLYIQVMELENSFEATKPNLTRTAIEAKGAKVKYLEKIRIGKYDGVYMEGPSKFDGETKIAIWFGNNDFTVAVIGVFENKDDKGRKGLLEIMKSTFYDETFDLNPLELANFELELEEYGFKLNSANSNTFVFTPNGKKDNESEEDVPVITIAAMPKMSENDAQKYMKDLIWRTEFNDYKLQSKEIKKVKVNNYVAYLLKTEMEVENEKGYIYQMVILGDTGSLLFVGMSSKKHENYPNKFSQIIETIKFK